MDRLTHVRTLAQKVGVGLRLAPGLAGMMYVEFGYVEGPTMEPENTTPVYPTAQSRHMVALHEIGHAWEGHTQGRPPFTEAVYYFTNGVLRSEAEAWEFALDNYPCDDLDSVTREWMWNTCLGSYYAGARAADGRPNQRLQNGDRGYYAFTYDKPDSYFWDVVDRFESKSADAARDAFDKEVALADQRKFGVV